MDLSLVVSSHSSCHLDLAEDCNPHVLLTPEARLAEVAERPGKEAYTVAALSLCSDSPVGLSSRLSEHGLFLFLRPAEI